MRSIFKIKSVQFWERQNRVVGEDRLLYQAPSAPESHHSQPRLGRRRTPTGGVFFPFFIAFTFYWCIEYRLRKTRPLPTIVRWCSTPTYFQQAFSSFFLFVKTDPSLSFLSFSHSYFILQYKLLYGEKLFCSLLHDTPSHVTTLWNYWKLKGSIRIMWIPSSGANLELNSMALFYPHFFYSPGIRKRERTLNFGKKPFPPFHNFNFKNSRNSKPGSMEMSNKCLPLSCRPK